MQMLRNQGRGLVGVTALLVLAVTGVAAQQAPIQQWESPLLRDHPLTGRIYAVAGKQWIAPEALVDSLRPARYVLIGEKHDNPDHHHLERWLVERLAATHKGLVFEMLDESQQGGVASLTPRDSLDQIRQKLAWPEKGWDFAMYGPVIQAGLERGMQIGAGNPSHDEIMDIYGRGEPALAGNSRFSTASSISPDVASHLLDEIYESHCKVQPKTELGPMVNVQAAKDASMAHELAGFPSAVLITGEGHADLVAGVPTHLHRLVPDARIRVVQIEEVSDSGSTPDWYKDVLPRGDFVWFTPKLTDKDYCEGVKSLRKQQ
ncbi:MAG TPA: ChaN family lipoprotein [Gemmatimonadales bacterium]|nr:ChaN family lipoprotein [Gemmatimonadales bacterium]